MRRTTTRCCTACPRASTPRWRTGRARCGCPKAPCCSRANAYEPHQAFRIGLRAWGVQFHPEFDAEVVRGYLDQLDGELRALGLDPDALRERVAATPTSAQLLGRFAHIAEEHDAGARTPA